MWSVRILVASATLLTSSLWASRALRSCSPTVDMPALSSASLPRLAMLESRGPRKTPAQAPVDRHASGLETPAVSRHRSPHFGGAVALAFLSACLASPAPGAAAVPPPAIHRSAAERLALPRLQAVQEDVRRLEASHRSLPPLAGLHDYRTVLHAHAEDAAHTGGTRAEMLADAQRAGVQAIFLSD